MLKVILNGVLGKDAEVKQVGNRNAINLNVAVNQSHKDKEGNKIENTQWVSAVWWKNENQSTKISEYLKKGKRVLIEGVPSAEGFQNKAGDIVAKFNVKIKDLEILN